MLFKNILKRITQPTSLLGWAMVTQAVTVITGKGAEVGDAVSGGLQSAAEASASGAPVISAIVAGILGGLAIVNRESER